MINLVKDMILNYRGNQIIKFAFHFLNRANNLQYN